MTAASSRHRPARRPTTPARRRRRELKRRARLLRLQAKVLRHRARRVGRRIAWHHRPWWERWPQELLLLEQDFPAEYEGFSCRRIGNALVYTGSVELDGIGIQRKVAIVFARRPSLYAPYVMADGPRPRRHRWQSHRPTHLCLWYYRDPKRMRWTLNNGLGQLIDLIRVHLIRELWFTATNEWRPELEHHPFTPLTPAKQKKEQLAGERRRCWCGSRRYRNCHGALEPADELAALGLG